MQNEPTENASTSQEAEQLRAKSPKLSAHYALPLSPSDTLVKIIKGYAIASNGGAAQVNYKDVASATGLQPTVVSRNNSFLSESQIITSPKYGYYIPSEAAVKFAREAAWDEANAKRHLRTTISGTWFGVVVTQNFMTRSSLTRDELRKVLAIKSGATEGDADSLGRLIDFLSYLGFILEGDHGAFTRQAASDETEAVSAAITDTPGTEGRPPVDVLKGKTNSAISTSGARIQINLNVNIPNLRDLTDDDARILREWIQKVLKSDDNLLD